MNEKAPWHFRLAKWMVRHRVRGGYHLLELADNFGWLNNIVCYQLNERIKMYVPLYRAANRWDRKNIFEYDTPTVDGLAYAINALDRQAVFVDCGADIGIMTMLVAMQTSNISRYIGIEPNKEAYQILQQNYNALPTRHKTINGAVGQFTGSGKLVDSEFYPGDDHARYIVSDKNGKIPVYRIDDLNIEKGRPV
ncbi:MAG: FkbM family methyltransferase, partial [Gammaproteobacteria bacterium]|nr:FkbM family methyltransferase [Gammaproteobacteria bacterium]